MTGTELAERLRATGHRLTLLPAGIATTPRPPPDIRALLAGVDGPRLRRELWRAWWADPRCDRCPEPLVGMTANGEACCLVHAKEHGAMICTDLLQEAEEKGNNKMVTRNTKATATGGGDYELAEEGFHEASITKVVEEAPPWANGESRVKWQFELNNGDITLTAWNGMSWSDGSNTRSGNPAKNYEWASAILGDLPEEFDDQDLVGKKCRVLIVHNQGKGQNADRTYANVQKVSRLEGKAEKAPRKYAPIPVPVPAGAVSEDEAPF